MPLTVNVVSAISVSVVLNENATVSTPEVVTSVAASASASLTLMVSAVPVASAKSIVTVPMVTSATPVLPIPTCGVIKPLTVVVWANKLMDEVPVILALIIAVPLLGIILSTFAIVKAPVVAVRPVTVADSVSPTVVRFPPPSAESALEAGTHSDIVLVPVIVVVATPDRSIVVLAAAGRQPVNL